MYLAFMMRVNNTDHGAEVRDEPSSNHPDSSACPGVKILYIGLWCQNIDLSELLTEQTNRLCDYRTNGKQASDAESRRLIQLAKQDSLSRPVSLMTRIMPDTLKYSK